MKTVSTLVSAAVLSLMINPLFSQSLDGGWRHALFICADSTVMSVGGNDYGQLGNGTTAPSEQHPAQIPGLTGITDVSAAERHSLFLKGDGTVWACGYNLFGSLGDGTITQRTSPVQVLGLTNIIAISAGGRHSLFLKRDGTVGACGGNYYGQLGDGTTNESYTAFQIPSISGIIAIQAGLSHSVFLKNDSTVWTCGTNFYGELGLGTSTGTGIPTPTMIPSFTGIKAISAGYDHSLALKGNGTVWAWGNNIAALGDGTTMFKLSPVQTDNVTNIIAIAAGANHSSFLKNDGTVWACGFNGAGEVGDGTTVSRNSPVAVGSLTGVAEIAAADVVSFFKKTNGTTWACGAGGYSQLGDGGFTSYSTPILSDEVCGFNAGFENEVLINVSIYPNPNNGVLNLNIGLQSNIKLQIGIYNLTGQLVKSITSTEFNEGINVKNVDASELSNGTYFVKFYNEDVNKTLKFIINK